METDAQRIEVLEAQVRALRAVVLQLMPTRSSDDCIALEGRCADDAPAKRWLQEWFPKNRKDAWE